MRKLGNFGTGAGGPSAQSATVLSTATGTLYTIARLLGGSSTLSLIAGTNSNLTLSGANIQAAVALGSGTTQVANVRETSGTLAVEYPISLTGNAALSISGTPSSGNVGTPYSFTPVVAGGFGAKSFTLSTGTLPAGLSLNATTGAISGTPSAIGTTLNLTITATDLSGSVSLGPFSIAIAGGSSGGGSSSGRSQLKLVNAGFPFGLGVM